MQAGAGNGNGPTPAGVPGRYAALLGATALAYALLHHIGSLPDGLGELANGTRRVDWLDLLTPYLILLPAAGAMVAARPAPRVWVLFAVGALAYSQGQGIHLAANSVGNDAPGEVAHLWDEDVGHYVWYAGVAAVTAALAATMRARPSPRGPVAYALVLAVGGTWATNAVGGGTEVASLVVAVGLAAYGWLHRRTLAVVLLVGYAAAVVILVARLPT